MKYYKGFDENLCCRGKQYVIGEETFTYGRGKLKMYSSTAIHFCASLNDTFRYYDPFQGSSRYCEVEPIGDVVSICDEYGARGIRVIREINPEAECGWDLKGAREFLEHLKEVKWLNRREELPMCCEIFDTRNDALNAAIGDVDCVEDKLDDEFRRAYREMNGTSEFRDYGNIWNTVEDGVCGALGGISPFDDMACNVLYDLTRDAELVCSMRYGCIDTDALQEIKEHVETRWYAWEAGYGVVCDANGVLYCY